MFPEHPVGSDLHYFQREFPPVGQEKFVQQPANYQLPGSYMRQILFFCFQAEK